ncbi:hypothetical protein EJ110_NYTH51788 [Nymphaea thermarum]|nr:hypothetical protein EJ110_NYTH51788 [Nymphaea thermarum]
MTIDYRLVSRIRKKADLETGELVKMSYMNKAVIAAGATATVQGLKDQGIRFNSVLRVLHQNARRNYASSTLLNRVSTATVASSSSSSSSLLQRKSGEERSKQEEESLRKVLDSDPRSSQVFVE